MLKISQIVGQKLQTQPFFWAEIGNLYSEDDAVALAATYPHDNFKTIEAYGGEKDYRYDARSLIPMGQNVVANASGLSEAWSSLAKDLLSAEYRAAMSTLTGIDLTTAPMEVNVYHFGPGSLLGPHRDLPEKRVVHVFYFNKDWDAKDGGCLSILNSANPNDIFATVIPLVGNSATFIRSDNSWHEVTRVTEGCRQSRRSMTVTFYCHDSVSSMWPPSDEAALHTYTGPGKD